MKVLMLLENEFLRDSRVEKEIQSLFKAGYEIIVAAITFSGLPSEEKRENCIVLRRKISNFIVKSSIGALKVPIYFNFWRRYIKEILASRQVDVIHIHDLPLCRIGIEAKKRYNIKLVIDLHENWPALLAVSSHTNTLAGKLLSSERQWRSYEKECVTGADRIITVAAEMKDRILKLGVPPDKICILENTPDRYPLNMLRFQRDNRYFTLVYVGGVTFHRGLQYVIRGMGLLVHELPVRLWIAGDGKYSPTLKRLVETLGLQDHIKFYGQVTKDESEDLLQKADLGLIPHIRSEQSDNSSPNKLFEYMAAGLPVLASDCTSVKRVIDDTGSGLTYIFDSPSDFADCVKRLCNERERTLVYGKNGHKAVIEKYNWENSSVSLLNLYEGMVKLNK